MTVSAFPGALLFRFLFFLLLPVLWVPVAAAGPADGQPAADSVVTVTAGKKYLRSGFHRFWFGRHYRRVWAEPVQVPVFRNPDGNVTLTPLKMGGSYQTKNLRLADEQGREFVLRSIDKDPARALPGWLRKTFVAGLMRDQTSVIHPYGAFIVPELASAAGIYHTNPRLVYLDRNETLGEYQEEFAGLLMLLEERPEGNRTEIASFGNSERIIGSGEALKELYTDPCNSFDARFYLRNRLFDMWIGDWSRREDQWRWATFRQNGKTLYRAIPRDRDHAFFLFSDGVITRAITWFKPTYQTFSDDYKNIEGLTRTGRPMDSYFLAMLSEADFEAEASHLKNSLTDEVIEKAVAGWPRNIYNLTGETFIRKLKARRDKLPEAARQYYRILNKEVTIPGTDKPERFELERLENGTVQLTLLHKNATCYGDTILARKTFSPEHTRKISLYGLGGKDVFTVSGKGRKKISVRIYPGAGEDKVIVNSLARGRKARTRIYTSDDGDEFEFKTKPSVKDQNDIRARDYDATGWLLRHRLH